MERDESTPRCEPVWPPDPLLGIVEQAYRIFTYPKPARTGVCENCCMDAAIERDFLRPSIRELPVAYVRDWYCAAWQVGGVPKEIWAYLLPRLLDLLAHGECLSGVGIEVSLNRFETGNPDKWSREEWSILDQFQRTYLAREIARGDGFLDDILCMFGLAGWDLHGLLDQVSSTCDVILAERLWNDWCRDCAPGHGSIWITAFWEGPKNTTVYEFYTSQSLYDRMEALALADDTDPVIAAKAAAVADIVAANR